MEYMDFVDWLHIFTGDHIYRASGGRWKSNGRFTAWLFKDNELASSFGSSSFWLPQRLAASEKPRCCSPN